MNVKVLDLDEIRFVYETYMTKDFPDDELKPFAMIEQVYAKKRYEALGVLDHDILIGEVEDFTLTEEPERELQERRYHFYLRNGLVDTGIRVWIFGVDYIILAMPAKTPLNEEMVKSLYLGHYKAMLPEHLYKTKVHMK